jgi:dTMP kinase
MKGLYVIFEGIVGTGKSTHSKKLCEYLKKKYPNREIILTREPGGSEIAEHIRRVVQGTRYSEEMEPFCEAYLYAAARAQSLRKIVKPVLDKGGIVISDRSFISSAAYQGEARNLGIDRVLDINKQAVDDIDPDIVVYIDLDAKTGLSRTSDIEGDKFERENVEFFKKIQNGYEKLSRLPQFKKKWICVAADKDIDSVFNDIITKITCFLPES